MNKIKIMIFVAMISLTGFLATGCSSTVLAASDKLEILNNGLLLKVPVFSFFAGDKSIEETGYISGSIKSSGDPSNSTLELYSNDNGRQNTGIKILPDGSVVMGGVVNNYAASSDSSQPPVSLPQGFENLTSNERRDGMYDFFLSIPKPNEDPNTARSRLYVRSLISSSMNDAGQFGITASGADRPGDRYGKMRSLPPQSNIGALKFQAFGQEGFGTAASIYAKLGDANSISDNEAGGVFAPASLFFATTGTDQRLTPRMTVSYNGNVGIGDGEMFPESKLEVRGNIAASGTKNFMIDHPLEPGKKLVHASIEGPEAAVYYRGESTLINGQATVNLPEYFEKLTRKEGRTVRLTNVDGFDKLAVKLQDEIQVKDGKFTVYSQNLKSNQKFYWEVKAVRSDIAPLEVEQKAE